MGAAIAKDGPPALQTMVSALLRTKLELAIAGLDGSGKTTFAGVLREEEAAQSTTPTIGLVVTRARQRGIDVVLWDLGGHQRFREDWGRHVRGCGALVFVVDCSDPSRFREARQTLQRLVEDPVVGRLPLLVLANKVDLLSPLERATAEVRGWEELARELHLDAMETSCGRWSVLGVSATRRTNLDKVLRWLVLQAHGVGDGGGQPPPAGSTELDAADGADGGSGRVWRLWESLWASGKVGRRSSRWRGFSLLSDASRSLLVEAA